MKIGSLFVIIALVTTLFANIGTNIYANGVFAGGDGHPDNPFD